MTNRKGKGGPTSPAGKSKVAQNAVKHGLSTMTPTGPNEQFLVKQFAKELLDFYQPQNPLAKLQIERIAVCRAKLARLYEVEQLRLQLVYQELEHQPQKIVEKLVGIHGVPKGMLMELVRHGQVALPCHLTPDLLKKICEEIHLFVGKIHTEENLYQFFPKLCEYLEAYPLRGLSKDANIFDRLLVVVERIEQVFKRGEQYDEMYRPFIEKIAEILYAPKQESEDEHTKEIMSFVKSTRNPNPKELAEGEDLNAKSIPSAATLLKKLKVFVDLFFYYERSLEALSQFEKVKDLLLESATLAPGESDLLMRYQTTLERRLSVAMGELLALEKQGSL